MIDLSVNEQFHNILNCLNSAYQNDKAAIGVLLINRVPCNKKLADHKHVVCEESKVYGTYFVGALGLINGILSAAELPLVATMFDDQTNKFLGFCKYENKEEKEKERKIVI